MTAALDLRPPEESETHVPANVEAEQALLGCILFDNSAYERVDDNLKPEHFFEPFHQRLYAAIEDKIRKGQLAEPILFATEFAKDPAFHELGGVRYLAELVASAPPAPNAPDYARVIHDLYLDRQLLLISQEAARSIFEDGTGTARDRIEAAEQALYGLAENRTRQGFRPFGDVVAGAIEIAAEAHSRDGGLAGISTGLIDLDQKLGGLHPSDLLIIAARPSMGKSSLAANIGFDVARNYAWEPQPDGARKTTRGGVVAFFSLEMSAEQLAMRIVSARAGVSGDRVRKGELDPVEFGRVRDAAIEVSEAPFFIDDTGGLSLAKLAARARRLKRTSGLDLLIVDYLQLVTVPGKRSDSRVQEVSEITQGLKALAKELHIPVIALSQLSRQVENREDKKPQLSDLRESGSIEQDADVVAFIYREEYYLERQEPREGTDEHLKWQARMDDCRGQADVIIGKQRHGPIGTVKLAFNADLTQFGNLYRHGYVGGRNPAGVD